MKKVLAWILVIGIFGLATISTTQLMQPTQQLMADDPKIGGGSGG